MADGTPEGRIRLGGLIREHRVSLGWSLTYASITANVHRNTWRNAEGGRVVMDGQLGRIERVLGWRPGSVIAVLDDDADDVSVDQPPETPLPSHVLDLSMLSPSDREHVRRLFERLRPADLRCIRS